MLAGPGIWGWHLRRGLVVWPIGHWQFWELSNSSLVCLFDFMWEVFGMSLLVVCCLLVVVSLLECPCWNAHLPKNAMQESQRWAGGSAPGSGQIWNLNLRTCSFSGVNKDGWLCILSIHQPTSSQSPYGKSHHNMFNCMHAVLYYQQDQWKQKLVVKFAVCLRC